MAYNNPWLQQNQTPQSTYGVDPSLISTTSTPSHSTGFQTNYLGQNVGASGDMTPGKTSSTYSGPGGTWTSTNNQAWTNPSGAKVSDLGGYLQMKNLLTQGANFQPYQNQLNQLLSNPSSVTETPGYQFGLQQGNEAINRSAAAKGMLNSGNVLAELAKYGQGMASQGYQQQLQNLQGLMQGAQNFGVQAGYYQPAPQAISQQFGAYAKPSYY